MKADLRVREYIYCMSEVNSWAVIKEEKTPMFGRKLPD